MSHTTLEGPATGQARTRWPTPDYNPDREAGVNMKPFMGSGSPAADAVISAGLESQRRLLEELAKVTTHREAASEQAYQHQVRADWLEQKRSDLAQVARLLLRSIEEAGFEVSNGDLEGTLIDLATELTAGGWTLDAGSRHD